MRQNKDKIFQANLDKYILSEFNRKQIEKVKDIDLNSRRKIIKMFRTEKKLFSKNNIILIKSGINIDHFCLGQTLYHLTTK